MGVLCLGCVYVGYKHKQIQTPPSFNLKNLTPSNLIYVSSLEALWMFAWGFGLFGDIY
jgi:hypothetical protein